MFLLLMCVSGTLSHQPEPPSLSPLTTSQQPSISPWYIPNQTWSRPAAYNGDANGTIQGQEDTTEPDQSYTPSNQNWNPTVATEEPYITNYDNVPIPPADYGSTDGFNNPGHGVWTGQFPSQTQPSFAPPNQIWNNFTVYGGSTNGGKHNSPALQINYYFAPGNYYPSYQPGESPLNQNWINPSIENANTYEPPPNTPRYYNPGNDYQSNQPGQPSYVPPNQDGINPSINNGKTYQAAGGSAFPIASAWPATMSQLVPRLGDIHAPLFQWHVGVYTKTFTPYMQICGGSLVKADVVLSAAHCFWKDDVGLLRPALFAVAAGKLLRPWDIDVDSYAQFSDVEDIIIPSRFQGGRTSFQDDIAIMMMTRPFEYAAGVKPVCVSFDLDLDRRQLIAFNLGTIAGWGLNLPNGQPSQRLNFLKLPYVDIDHCIRSAEPSFLRYITSDKICAGDQRTGRALCRGDSGGGLVFYMDTIPYIRGIASTAPRDGAGNECNAYAIASFTHVLAQRTFLVDNVPDITEGCEELYSNETSSAPEQLLQSGTQGSSNENVTSNTDVLEQSTGDKSNSDKNNTETMQDQKEEEQIPEMHTRSLELIMPKSTLITKPSQNLQSINQEYQNVTTVDRTLESQETSTSQGTSIRQEKVATVEINATIVINGTIVVNGQ